MRLSVYHFKDIPRSYAVLQFEEGEVGKVLNEIKRIGDPSVIKSIASEALSCELRGVSLAVGKLLYRGKPLEMVYVRLELEDDREYVFEIYEESAMIHSNTNAMEALNDIKKLMKAIYPGLRDRYPTLLGI